ncbi:pyroglutamyl-peptidase I [Paenibacillus arenosi]|uniref:Pyrrolidone-carboxylate peptidase n=1 Tax=Paenibacillus arenosi TaxID=2774142 RepID=A0ABR9B1A8_9BACL|nr:pyroglutamyl-peptidase I [Paenibacillus arenosi]MBD8498966.1 pyroglutamyl-peptidase I [Paenibacillus arenosi]
MKKLLITGFDPFNGEEINPSWEAVRTLDGHQIGAYQVKVLLLPTTFQRSGELLKEVALNGTPDVIWSVGQAGGRPDITLERVAINGMDAVIPDNDGAQPVDEQVVVNGPAAYWTTLPLKVMKEAIQKAGVPCSVSYTAGTYVCNSTFYKIMHMIQTEPLLHGCRGGFVHIPFIPEQAVRHPGKPSMSLEYIRRALIAGIEAIDEQELNTVSAGILHGES